MAGVDEYLDVVTVLPPRVFDPNIRVEPPEQTPTQESRKLQSHCSIDPEVKMDDDNDLFDFCRSVNSS